MTRSEAIAIIEKALPVADEAALSAAAELLQSACTTSEMLPRPLTARETALLERSHEDFQQGRTYTHAEVVEMLDKRLAPRGVPKSTG